ncbi:Exosome complex component CSL4 [Clydaea vesicula]|uniref:Exosome complex component CSL4 n=1 Tax=Clydaea vesicula TaxID=447962 RepID=A0AAD5XW95_9FUNG|nr:Exosome complex component CSL4 [Clydaea vesicula]KAJ3381510.1 Exosome complex component CSL4 [Lobulomyces angularis]
MENEKVSPGVLLNYASHNLQVGPGCYEKEGNIYASVCGYKSIEKLNDNSNEEMIFVKKLNNPTSVPSVNDIITGKVIRVNPRFATVSILVVGAIPCSEAFQGIVRVQDIRATERDKVQVYKSFRPSDIIRARVISLGDTRSYFLSTAENELGCILSQSVAGYTMVPISWEQMICPKTKTIEFRKCAKPV